MLKNIIFDFDGVIRDYFTERRIALKEAFISVNGIIPSDNLILEILLAIEKNDKNFPQKTMKWIINKALKDENIKDRKEIFKFYTENINKNRVINNTFLKNIDVIKRYKLFIFTSNSTSFVINWLAYFQLDGLFTIFSTKDFGKGKPCLSLLRTFIPSQNIDVKETIYIGDSFVDDILPAMILNIKTISFNSTSYKSTTSFDDIVKILLNE